MASRNIERLPISVRPVHFLEAIAPELAPDIVAKRALQGA